MPQLAQGLGLDLPDALARDVEEGAHLFQRPLRAVVGETGSCAALMMLFTLSTGSSSRSAISSGVGSRPSSWTSLRDTRTTRLMCSIMWTGTRMVRAWSAIARVIACRIHHVA